MASEQQLTPQKHKQMEQRICCRENAAESRGKKGSKARFCVVKGFHQEKHKRE